MDCNVQIGAHLVTPRKWYEHHGLYVGDGRVVHYAGFSRLLHRGPVEEISLEQFAKRFGFRVEPHAIAAFPPEEIIGRARTRLGEDRYGVLSNNCEHFVHWCVSGCARSGQVEKLFKHPAQLARAAADALSALARFLFGEEADSAAVTN